MNLRDAIIKLSLGNILTRALQLGGIAAFTHLLGSGAMGSFFLFQSLLGMIGVPADLGVSRAVEKRVSSGCQLGEVFSTSIVVKGVLLSPWILLSVIGAPHISNFVGVERVLPLLLLGFVIREGRKLSVRVIAGQLKIEKVAVLRLIGKLAWVVVGLVLIWFDWGVFAIIIGIITSDLVILSGTLLRMDVALSWPRWHRARDLVSFGKFVSIGSVGGLVYSWMDVTMLRVFGVSTELIGAYEIAWRVAGAGMLVTGAIRESLFSKISDWYSRGEISQIEEALYTWVQPSTYLTIAAFAGAIVLGDTVLGVVFSGSVVVAYPVLIIFMAEKVVRSVNITFSPSLYAINQPRLAYRGTLANILTNLVLNIALIPFLGIIGAALATAIGAVASTFVSLYYVHQFITIRLPLRRLAWSAVAAATMSIIVWQSTTIIQSGWGNLIIGVTIGVLSYFSLLLCYPSIRKDAQSIFKSLDSRF